MEQVLQTKPINQFYILWKLLIGLVFQKNGIFYRTANYQSEPVFSMLLLFLARMQLMNRRQSWATDQRKRKFSKPVNQWHKYLQRKQALWLWFSTWFNVVSPPRILFGAISAINIGTCSSNLLACYRLWTIRTQKNPKKYDLEPRFLPSNGD